MDRKKYESMPSESRPEKGDTVTFNQKFYHCYPRYGEPPSGGKNMIIDDIRDVMESGDPVVAARVDASFFKIETLTIERKKS